MSGGDLHLHTRFSDGALAPAELLRLIRSKGLETLSITDHDTMEAYAEAIPMAQELGLRLIPGVEVSTTFKGEDCHVLVYGLGADDPAWQAHLKRQKSIRYHRAKSIVGELSAAGVDITLEEVIALAGHLTLGRFHIARVLVAKGAASTTKEAFDKWLSPVSSNFHPVFPDTIAVIRDVNAMGGLAVLAHPGGDFSYTDMKTLVDAGLGGIEAAHPKHDARVRRKWMEYAQRVGIVSTGGSDYHGHRTGEERHIGQYLTHHELVTTDA